MSCMSNLDIERQNDEKYNKDLKMTTQKEKWNTRIRKRNSYDEWKELDKSLSMCDSVDKTLIEVWKFIDGKGRFGSYSTSAFSLESLALFLKDAHITDNVNNTYKLAGREQMIEIDDVIDDNSDEGPEVDTAFDGLEGNY